MPVLTPDQFQQLQRILTDAFDKRDIAELVRTKLGERLDNLVDPDQPTRQIVFDLLTWIDKRDMHMLEVLLQGAIRMKPENNALRAFCEHDVPGALKPIDSQVCAKAEIAGHWRVRPIVSAAAVAVVFLVGWIGYLWMSANRPVADTPVVLGGVNSSITDWPWSVSVLWAGQFLCNGTLIAPRMVLSTANCVDREKPTKYEVATAIDDGKHLKIGRRIRVAKIVVHPAYSDDPLKNDIAILELGMELPPPFSTISAQRSADPKAGSLALVGAIDFRSNPGNLLQSSVAIFDCTAKSAQEGTICAGFEHGGAGACGGTGSAGGALVLFSDLGRKYQVGSVSWADCSVPEAAYGVYTRISSYVDWIKQVVPDVLSEPMTDVKR